jgi:hypothetical protein
MGSVGAEGEDYVDRGFDFDGFAVKSPGAVAGLTDGVDGGGDQRGWATEDAQALDAAMGRDGGGHDDGSLSSGGDGDGWVMGLDMHYEEASDYSGGDMDGAGGCGGVDQTGGRWGGEAETWNTDESVMMDPEIDYAWDARARNAWIDDLDGAVRDSGGETEVESDGLWSRRGRGRLCDDRCGGCRWSDEGDVEEFMGERVRIKVRDKDDDGDKGRLEDERTGSAAGAAGADASSGFDEAVFEHDSLRYSDWGAAFRKRTRHCGESER